MAQQSRKDSQQKYVPFLVDAAHQARKTEENLGELVGRTVQAVQQIRAEHQELPLPEETLRGGVENFFKEVREAGTERDAGVDRRLLHKGLLNKLVSTKAGTSALILGAGAALTYLVSEICYTLPNFLHSEFNMSGDIMQLGRELWNYRTLTWSHRFLCRGIKFDGLLFGAVPTAIYASVAPFVIYYSGALSKLLNTRQRKLNKHIETDIDGYANALSAEIEKGN